MARILICDDEEAIAQLLRRYLTIKGHEVDTVGSVDDALEKIEGAIYDAVVTDLNLHGLDGFELMQEIRARGFNLPILFTTGYPSQETAIKALREGAFDYLVKPFALEEVAERLERAVTMRRIREENAVYARLVSLQAVGKLLAQATSLEGLAQETARLAVKLLRCDHGWFYQGMPGDSAILPTGMPMTPPARTLAEQAFILSLSEKAMAAGEPITSEDALSQTGFYLAIPVEMRSAMVGAVVVRRDGGKSPFDTVDFEVGAQLAVNVGLNLRALGFNREQASQAPVEKALSAWADLIGQLVDQHCPDYESKLQRVFALGHSLIQALDWGHLGQENWRLLSQVYDLAKLRVPQRILTKEGPLDDKEKEFIKKQVRWAKERLSDVPGMEPAAQALDDLQEAFDGSGYPRGKRGHAIDSAARLLAVVDSYVAMTSTRPYRSPMRPREAIEAIRKKAGTQYDPEIVLALTSLGQN